MLHRKVSGAQSNTSAIWHEALTSRGVLLLAGGVAIGYVYGPEYSKGVSEQFLGAFKALLALFLLEMGRCASKYIYPLPIKHWRLILFALIAPLLLAVGGLLLAKALSLPEGTSLILATLIASASYIAAPAAIRSAIKEADVGLAIFAALGVTFPLNVLLGIPFYHQLMQWLF
jgi:uncharacterized protein